MLLLESAMRTSRRGNASTVRRRLRGARLAGHVAPRGIHEPLLAVRPSGPHADCPGLSDPVEVLVS